MEQEPGRARARPVQRQGAGRGSLLRCRPLRGPLLLFLSFFPLLAAAGEASGPDEEERVFQVITGSPVRQFNPLHAYTSDEAQVFTALHEGLVTYHPFTLEPLPGVAEGWEISADRRTYLFRLRADARYWTGEPVTARDFRQSWLRLLDPEEGAEYSFFLDVIKGARAYRTGVTSDPASVAISAPDSRTLRVELREPAEHFLKLLCHHSLAPVHPRFLDQKDWRSLKRIPGNGPFFVDVIGEEGVELKKNQLYWDRNRVELDRIVIRYSQDGRTAARAYNEGEVHWLAGGADPALLKERSAMVVNPLFATTYLFFRAEGVLADPRIRRGLGLLLPWDEIRSRDYSALPAETLVPEIRGYPPAEGLTAARPEEGLALLAEAGYPGGRGLPELVLRISPSAGIRRIAGIVKKSWEALLDRPVTLDIRPFDTYFQSLKEPGYALGHMTWIGDYADPLTFLQMWTGGSNLNDAGYASKTYDGLIHAAMGEPGRVRYQTLSRAESILLKDAVVLPVEHYPAFNVIDPALVKGWYPNPLDLHPFKYIVVGKPELPPFLAAAGRAERLTGVGVADSLDHR